MAGWFKGSSDSSSKSSRTLDPLRLRSLSFTEPAWRHEAWMIFKVGIPISLSISSRIFQFVTDTAILGHYGTKYLAAASLADVWYTMATETCFSFAMAVSVFSSQAFGQSQTNNMVSQWFHLGLVLSTVIGGFVMISLQFTRPVLAAFLSGAVCKWNHIIFEKRRRRMLSVVCVCVSFATETGSHTEDDDYSRSEVLDKAGEFGHLMSLFVWPTVWMIATRMYFRAQSMVLQETVCNFLFLGVNVLLNFILVFGFIIGKDNRLGFLGAPIATATTRFLTFIAFISWMFFYRKHHSRTWITPFRWETYSPARIAGFCAIAFPQMIGSFLQNCQIQVLVLFAGRLNSTDLATFASMVTMVMACHVMLVGLGQGVQVRVANLLGGNRASAARYTSMVGLTIGAMYGTVMAFIFVFFGQDIGHIMSNDSDVIRKYGELAPLVGSGLAALALFSISVSILIAQARVKVVAILSVFCCWIVSVPLAYGLGLHTSMKLYGLWTGIMLGYFLFAVLSTFMVIFQSDWSYYAEEAVKRSKDERDEEERIALMQRFTQDRGKIERRHSDHGFINLFGIGNNSKKSRRWKVTAAPVGEYPRKARVDSTTLIGKIRRHSMSGIEMMPSSFSGFNNEFVYTNEGDGTTTTMGGNGIDGATQDDEKEGDLVYTATPVGEKGLLRPKDSIFDTTEDTPGEEDVTRAIVSAVKKKRRHSSQSSIVGLGFGEFGVLLNMDTAADNAYSGDHGGYQGERTQRLLSGLPDEEEDDQESVASDLETAEYTPGRIGEKSRPGSFLDL